MSEEQQKPIDILIYDAREEIVRLLNDSGLSIGIIAMLLRELSTEITNQALLQMQLLNRRGNTNE